MFEVFYGYYYLIIVFQAVCVIHALRNGLLQKWIWLIVFLPLIGSIAYFFTEIIQKRHVNKVQNNVGQLINPGGRIRDLEKKFRFSDTFTNRIVLADAYLNKQLFEEAIELYESGLTGVFEDNEHVVIQLMKAYFSVGRYEDVVKLAEKIKNNAHFSSTTGSLVYAQALEKIGNIEAAEKQFSAMNHRFSNYEARYLFGEFLKRNNRMEQAQKQFQQIVDEAEQMNRKEKSHSITWINKSKEELK